MPNVQRAFTPFLSFVFAGFAREDPIRFLVKRIV